MFATVNVCVALSMPIGSLGKTTESVTVTDGSELPCSAIACGLVFAVSATLSEAVSLPAVSGVKSTPTVHESFGWSVTPVHASPTIPKSDGCAPVSVRWLTVTAAVPLSSTTTVWAALVVSNVMSPKLSPSGLTVTGSAEKPSTVADCGEPVASSLTWSAAS